MIARRCDAVYLRTVFYDPEFVAKNPVPGAKFTDSVPVEHADVSHTLHRFNYRESLDWKGFCGGGDVFSQWMGKADIPAAFARFGLGGMRTLEEPNVHRSALMIAARRGLTPRGRERKGPMTCCTELRFR